MNFHKQLPKQKENHNEIVQGYGFDTISLIGMNNIRFGERYDTTFLNNGTIRYKYFNNKDNIGTIKEFDISSTATAKMDKITIGNDEASVLNHVDFDSCCINNNCDASSLLGCVIEINLINMQGLHNGSADYDYG